MAAQCPDLEAQMDSPPPLAYRITLTKHQVSLVKQAAKDFASTSVYGHIIGHLPSWVDIRDLASVHPLP